MARVTGGSDLRKAIEKALAGIEARLDRLGDKDELTDRDDELMGLLETLQEQCEEVTGTLDEIENL